MRNITKLLFTIFTLISIESYSQGLAYPNPTKDIVNIPVKPDSSNLDVIIFDVNGKIINRQQVQTNDSIINIDLSYYDNNIYFLRLKEQTYKVIKF